MKNINLKRVTLLVGAIAFAMFVYIIYESKMPSYLSSDPKACINCHAMNTQYATWQHSSHAQRATCVDCHLPTDSNISKYVAKSIDGWNHSVAFTLKTYDNTIKISDYGAERVQKNCISCHKSVTSTLVESADKYHNYNEQSDIEGGRKCWECHKSVPHGKVRGITTTPYNLGVKEKNQ